MNSDTSVRPQPGEPARDGDRPWARAEPGRRVVIRRRLTPAEAAAARAERRGAVWTDVIGFVSEVSDDGLRVRTDPRPGRGEPAEISVPADLIESVKPVPPRPDRAVRRPDPPR